MKTLVEVRFKRSANHTARILTYLTDLFPSQTEAIKEQANGLLALDDQSSITIDSAKQILIQHINEPTHVVVNWFKETGKWYSKEEYVSNFDIIEVRKIEEEIGKRFSNYSGMSYTYEVQQGDMWNSRLVKV